MSTWVSFQYDGGSGWDDASGRCCLIRVSSSSYLQCFDTVGEQQKRHPDCRNRKDSRFNFAVRLYPERLQSRRSLNHWASVYSVYAVSPQNVHLFIFWITLSDLNDFWCINHEKTSHEYLKIYTPHLSYVATLWISHGKAATRDRWRDVDKSVRFSCQVFSGFNIQSVNVFIELLKK